MFVVIISKKAIHRGHRDILKSVHQVRGISIRFSALHILVFFNSTQVSYYYMRSQNSPHSSARFSSASRLHLFMF